MEESRSHEAANITTPDDQEEDIGANNVSMAMLCFSGNVVFQRLG